MAYQTAIPPGCWNTPGFRDCANLNWALAQKVCANRGDPTDECAGPLYDVAVMGSCPCDPPHEASPQAAAAAAETAPSVNWTTVATVGLFGLGLYMLTKGSS